jgi:predicted nucleic acid-binding protein
MGTVFAHGVEVVLPALTRIEIGCASARRHGHVASTQALAALDELPVRHGGVADAAVLEAALHIGTRARLRTLDAILAATAITERATLVTWDRELLERAVGVTPGQWLEAMAAEG